MKRAFRTAIVPGLLVVLTACGAAGTGGTIEATAPPAVTAIVSPPAVELDAAPATASMESLGLSGEHFAAAGDPGAPVTVIEFSDFG
jgi:hypothetical protein